MALVFMNPTYRVPAFWQALAQNRQVSLRRKGCQADYGLRFSLDNSLKVQVGMGTKLEHGKKSRFSEVKKQPHCTKARKVMPDESGRNPPGFFIWCA
jgi:hypothetical protein